MIYLRGQVTTRRRTWMAASGGRPRREHIEEGLWLRDGRAWEATAQRNRRGYRKRLGTTDTMTKTDARKAKRAWIADLDRGLRPTTRTDITVPRLWDGWQAWAESPASPLAPRTAELYMQKRGQVV